MLRKKNERTRIREVTKGFYVCVKNKKSKENTHTHPTNHQGREFWFQMTTQSIQPVSFKKQTNEQKVDIRIYTGSRSERKEENKTAGLSRERETLGSKRNTNRRTYCAKQRSMRDERRTCSRLLLLFEKDKRQRTIAANRHDGKKEDKA